MAVAKRQGREKALENRTKKGLRTRVTQTALLASPIYIGMSRGRIQKNIKIGAKIGLGASLLFGSFGSACSPLLSK